MKRLKVKDIKMRKMIIAVMVMMSVNCFAYTMCDMDGTNCRDSSSTCDMNGSNCHKQNEICDMDGTNCRTM